MGHPIPACRRTTKDPLLRILLHTYGLHLLAAPRKGASVGDLYAVRRGAVAASGRAGSLLTPPPRFPRIQTEALADVSGTASRRLAFHSGLGLLEVFLAAFIPGPVIPSALAIYDPTRVKTMTFRFMDAERQSMDVFKVGSKLAGCTIDRTNPIFSAKQRYFLVTAAVRASSIAVTCLDRSRKEVDISLGSTSLGIAGLTVTAQKTSEGSVSYKGPKRLVFGVELLELRLNGKTGTLAIDPPTQVVNVRGSGQLVPRFVGGKSGTAFIAFDEDIRQE